MKIIALGTSTFVISCVKGLIKSGHEIICLVSEPEKILPVNSINIKNIAGELQIPYFETDDINSHESCRFLESLKPDFIFSAWSKIIKENVLKVPLYGVIGSHPTPLPFNKGSHPLHWQIVLGIKESMLSFFKMDRGIDSGEILLQIPYNIHSSDNIKTLSDRINKLALTSALSIGEMLNRDDYGSQGKTQNHLDSNSWRKRTLFDVIIDFRMTGDNILSLIRSFTFPFSGALIINKDSFYHVMEGLKTNDSDTPVNSHFIENGKNIVCRAEFNSG
jgi:methionyl-tRNA formyltransferase